MDKVFNAVKSNVSVYVKNLTDQQLENDSYRKTIVDENLVKHIALNKANMKTEIKQQILSINNSPTNFSFTPGTEYDYVIYTIPVTGNSYAASELFKTTHVGMQGLFYNAGSFYYKEFSKQRLKGNDAALDQIRESVKAQFAIIETVINDFNTKADNFNEKDLPQIITDAIQEEKNKRARNKSDLDRLKF